jgi:hypothetical protein
MHFVRSAPKRSYRNYASYRPLLRHDFLYRCAYCLTHEYFLGGEANFVIDHRRPRNGEYARPDLANDYTNLYYACNECNQNKGDAWPSPTQEAEGYAWIDPCDAEGDHERHWRISPEGTITWLTPVGEYTVKRLLLHRREWLKRHWRKLHQWQEQSKALRGLLASREMPGEVRAAIETELTELDELLHPPVFDRPRRDDE